MGEDLGEGREPLSEWFSSLSKPLPSLPNFPEPGDVQRAREGWLCVGAPGSGKFLLDWGGSEIGKRAVIAHVWWAVAALFALLAKIRWGAGGRFFCLTFILFFFAVC